MANTILTKEDLDAFERRVMDFLERRFRQLQEQPGKKFYRPKEVAELAGLTVHAIRHRLRDPNERLLRGIQESGVCGSWLIPRESVEAWIESLKGKGGRPC